jgi:Hemerythrin HHE cation binding domain
VPDVVPLIMSQHRELEELLEQATQEDTDTLALLRQVAAMLRPHSEAEESFVYPRIAELRSEEAEEVHDGTAEHHHAESVLDELLAADPDGPGYDGRLAGLIGELKHHIEEEESELLPVLSEQASDDERAQLGERFAAATGSSEVRPDAGSQAPSEDATKTELYEQAKDADIPGRSTMTKDELAQAISEKG